MATDGRVLIWDKLKIYLAPTESPTKFEDKALCTEHEDPDLWYSEGADNGGRGGDMLLRMANNMARSYEALRICAMCPSKDTCAEEGMRTENLHWGIWGGTMAGERLVKAGVPILSSDNKNKVAFARRMRDKYGYL
jgi:hypothetical protein